MSSNEVNAAVGASPKTERDAEIEQLDAELAQQRALERKAQRRAQLGAERDAEEKRARLAELKGRAKKLLVAIAQGDGSLATLEPQDDRAVRETGKAHDAAKRTRNGRADKRARYRRAAQLLAATFGLPVPALPDIRVPSRSAVADEGVGIAGETPLAATLYLAEEPDHAELGDLDGDDRIARDARDLLRQQRELAPPTPSPVKAAMLAAEREREAARIARRP